jgi:hypothetical protein
MPTIMSVDMKPQIRCKLCVEISFLPLFFGMNLPPICPPPLSLLSEGTVRIIIYQYTVRPSSMSTIGYLSLSYQYCQLLTREINVAL